MVLAQPLPGAGPDSDRLLRARLGDSNALQELIISHRSLVEREARRFVSDHDDIEDIAQETWIRAAQALGSLRDESRFRPWLRTITRNACLTFLSRHQHSDSLDDDDAPDPADRASDGPEASAEQRDERRRVWEALGALTELDRRALYLREVESLPFDEVARRLGVRKNAAEVRVHRARTRFRQLYEATDATSPACGMAGIRLALHLEGELHGETAVAVETHLSSCAACALRMRKMADGRSLYRRMGMFSLPGLTGLLERFQRFADSAIRWFPVDAAPVIASSGSAPASAVSGMTTAVVAAVVLAMPSMVDLGQTVAARVPLPSPVTTMLTGRPPDDAPVLVTPSPGAADLSVPPPAAASPTVPMAGTGRQPSIPPTLDAGPDIDYGPTGGPGAPVAAPAGTPAAVAVPPIQVLGAAPTANSAPLAIASAPSGAAVVSTEGGSPTKDQASKPRGESGSKDNEKDSRARDDRSRDERDDRGRDSRSKDERDARGKDDERGALKASAWAKGEDLSGGRGGGNQKSDDGPKGSVSASKGDDGGARGTASGPRGDDGSNRPSVTAPRGDDGGNRPSQTAPRGDDGGQRPSAPAPRGEEGGNRGSAPSARGDDGGGRSNDGGHGNEGGGKGGGNGKH